ncbi:MAG: hypothetical protein F6J87_19075 [Spirulina sp. SIO3F2]|nr:hypothetical protein [Spirulina sp. SIO3F2]
MMNLTFSLGGGTHYTLSESDFGELEALPPLFQTSCLDTIKATDPRANQN